jgi:hypothetical protein
MTFASGLAVLALVFQCRAAGCRRTARCARPTPHSARALRNKSGYFRHGKWPTDLAEAARELPVPMATEKAGAYYFARRGDDFVVLLPEE